MLAYPTTVNPRRGLTFLVGSLLLLAASPTGAIAQYKLPPKDVVELLAAPPTPLVTLSPDRSTMALIGYDPYPPIALLSRPFHGLAGIRVDPGYSATRRTSRNTSLTLVDVATGKQTPVPLPANMQFNAPVWSPRSDRLVFTEDSAGGLRLWTVDARTGAIKVIDNLQLTDVLGGPMSFLEDGDTLIVRAVPLLRGQPPTVPATPDGPAVQETNGRRSRQVTRQDMLDNPHEESLFEFYATTQLAKVSLTTGKVTYLGNPALYAQVVPSPDGKYLLTTRLRRPFAYRLAASGFPRTTEILDATSGQPVKLLAELPSADTVPPEGVPMGPRAVEWNEHAPASLIWCEALDRGDPDTKAGFRDKLVTLAAPFTADPTEITRLRQRYSALDFTGKPDQVLITEVDRRRRWTTTYFIDLTDPEKSRRVLFDLSVNDAYRSPGSPLYITTPTGRRMMLQDGDNIYLTGPGASPEGDRPFLDRHNLVTGETTRLFQSPPDASERFVAFPSSTDRSEIITYHQSPTSPPNYLLRKLAAPFPVTTRPTTMPATADLVRPITHFPDPHPQLTGITKQLLNYTRDDGVQLSFTLYLPPDYKPGQDKPLPAIFWAYPREYTDDDTAGQVRSSPNNFVRLTGNSPLMFLTQGYAVMMDVAMPVVGPTRTMNDTFVQQITADAKAAIDTAVATGHVDRRRILVSGHSYGAFMTANLLAHTDFFAAGIARSGAYNRTLTPFGFQSELRNYWDAKDVYMAMSPFNFANKIRTPLLLIHGEVDNNPGTFPIQSQRLYEALAGFGTIARLVILPYESHGYAAQESIRHVLAESFEWADKYAKHRRPPSTRPSTSTQPSTHPTDNATPVP